MKNILDTKIKDGILNLEKKEYFIDETINLTKNTEKLIINGNGATIAAGKKLDNWVKKDKYYVHSAHSISYCNQLYKNGIMIERPHSDFIKTGAWEMHTDDNYVFHDKKTYQEEIYYDGYLCKHKEMINYINADCLELIYDVGWTHCICPIESIKPYDDDYVYLKMKQPTFRNCQIKKGMQINSPNQVYNIYENIKKGQWYFNKKEKEIIYYPLENEDVDKQNFVLPIIDTLIEIDNCKNIEFNNVTFSYSSWIYSSIVGLPDGQANLCKNFEISPDQMTEYYKPKSAIRIKHSSNIKFNECKFEKLGCCAVDLDEGVKNIDITSCNFNHIAANALMIGEFNFKCGHEKNESNIVEHINVLNNEFYEIGSIYRSGVAILAGYVRNTNICHNEINEVAYTGISLGWGWGFDDPNYKYSDIQHDRMRFGTYDDYGIMENNHIDYNHVHNVMSKMHDGSGIYTLSMNKNSTVIGNYVHDNGSFKGTPYDKLFYFRIKTDKEKPECKALIERDSFPGGIYLDEGSGGFTVKDNVIEKVACPLFYHFTGITGVFETNTYENNYIKGENTKRVQDIIKYAGKAAI